MQIGYNSGGYGVLVINSGITGNSNLTLAGNHGISIAPGTLNNTGTLSSAVYSYTSGNSTVAGLGMNAGSFLGFDTTNAAGGTFTIADTIANTTGAAGGARGLTKLGTNTLVLSGTNSHTGATTVIAGTLKLAGGSLANTAISCTGTSTLAVQPASATTITAGNTATTAAGATLNLGAQTFDMTDGFVSTFNLVQESTFAGAVLTVTGGATLKFNLGTAGADLLAVTKSAAVTGIITVTLDTTGAGSLTPGTYNLITATSGLTLVFNRASASVPPETTLTVEWGSDLNPIANSLTIGTSDVGPSGDNPTVDIDAPAAGQVTVNIPAANASGGKLFARLKAVQP
jgi:autotransporter-associated beta strand protein